MSLLINCSTLEGRKAKDDHPHFSDWETQEAINGLQKIIDPASGRPETLPRTSDSKSCASSLLNSEKRLLLIKKTLKSGLGVFRGWPKKTRKYTLPGEDSSLPAHSPVLSSIFLSIRVFSNESALHVRWPKHWSLRINPSNEFSGLISFRIDWFDLLAVQGSFKHLLQHHNSKAAVLWRSAFFMVQLPSSTSSV